MITLQATRIHAKNTQEDKAMHAWTEHGKGPDDMTAAGLSLGMLRQRNHVKLTGEYSFLFQAENGIVDRPSARLPEDSLNLAGRVLMAYLETSRRSILADKVLPEINDSETRWTANFFPEGVVYFQTPSQLAMQGNIKNKVFTHTFFETHIRVKFWAENAHETIAQTRAMCERAQGIIGGWCLKMSAFLGDNALNSIPKTQDIAIQSNKLKL